MTVVLIVFLFPKGGKFKYDYFKGKPWLYENYYAPFNFAIQKTQEDINIEKLKIEQDVTLYFEYDKAIVESVYSNFDIALEKNPLYEEVGSIASDYGKEIISAVYKSGFIGPLSEDKLSPNSLAVTIRKGTLAIDIAQKDLIKSKDLLQYINASMLEISSQVTRNLLLTTLSEVIKPNIRFDEEFTNKVKNDQINNISYTTGFVAEKELVILKGDIVEGKKLKALNSIQRELESQVWSESNYNWVVFGYSVLVALAILMLLLFIRKTRPEIYENNTKTTLIFINVALMIFLVTIVVKYDAKYVYAVPLTILPIILKAFFDARLGLFAHVLTILLLGFIVPNSFEFIFLQIIAGIVTILTVSELYKRVNLFISIGQITVVYMIAYIAFTIIQEGNINDLNWFYFGLFTFSGILAFLSTILIFIYEKLFGLVSDVSLLELSNTNSPLLRLLAEEAPGTFQHSMQVANLAEAAANEINANTMLVRTGALYHDIGKLKNPMYFTENQITNVNPHGDISHIDSASIIITHVIEGIKLAKKYRLPDRIIDFIRTHHGTSLVYYFYMLEKEANPDAFDEAKFRYPGPNPFSKETAILMMCDAAEAASKSLKEPTAQAIDNLIEKIISKQMEEGQFNNADITFRDIESVKKVLKKKVKNIYHVRIEYPE
jgi:putative nucleotidyltransferase with HDIG domain|tara:strand:- start:334 stop:2316 length:1983 start_codon:yes stop_codon:yes gene_type:complete